jgi:hypothetical protein
MRANHLTRKSSVSEFAALAPQIRQRLVAEGITSLSDWVALGPKRFGIFGITRSTAKEIDSIAGMSR